MNKLLLTLALMSAVAAHAAVPTDCAADISKQLQQDSEVHVNVRPNAKLCVNVNEPIISVEYTNGDQPLRWQTPQDGGYTMVIRAAEDAYPMRWNSIISDGNTLVMTAPEDAYPVGVYVKTAAGKTYHFQAAQTNGLDY